MKLNFKKDLACNITLICVLSLSLVYFVLLTLNLFNVFSFAFPQSFSYITAYLLMILCFGLYILGFFIESRKNIKIPTWFKMTFYIAFFIFTNIYYVFGLYHNLVTLLMFVAFITFILNIIALSLYFNLNKDENNKLKASTKGFIFNTSIYSVAISSVAIFLISAFNVIFLSTYIFSTLSIFVIEMTTSLVVCAVVSTIFAFSHKKSKIIINNCLIKVTKNTIVRSLKQKD